MSKLDCILLVDDNEADNFMHEMVLEDAGVCDKILTATNGRSALEVIAAHDAEAGKLPNLIFLDINMPIMNGWEFMERFEQLDNIKDVKVVVLSTSLNPKDKKLAAEHALVHTFLNKPLTEALVQQMVGELFS